jgi:hypothetical protein
MQVSTIGVDLAKNVFQVHGVDSSGKVVISRQLRRKQVIDFFSKMPPCLVGMEACGTAHHWAREVSKLGHTVRLMPPSYVKGYVKRSKNDAADAAAICEAVTRPSMRFVPDQVVRPAGRADVASNEGSFNPSAHATDQCAPSPPCRVRPRCGDGTRRSRPACRDHHRRE